jgi:dTDP-4-amino-4,6-dideoxygalactose transaminase
MSVSAADRHASVLAPPEEYAEIGFNFRMTDLQAAVGLVQLHKLSQAVERRREIAEVYAKYVDDIDGLRSVADPVWGRSNFQSFWIEVEDPYPLDRDGLLEHLARLDISARRGIMTAHRQPAHASVPLLSLPASEHLSDHTLILPLFHQMSVPEQARVIDALMTGGRGTPWTI